MVYFNYYCIILIIRAVNQYVNELTPLEALLVEPQNSNLLTFL